MGCQLLVENDFPDGSDNEYFIYKSALNNSCYVLLLRAGPFMGRMLPSTEHGFYKQFGIKCNSMLLNSVRGKTQSL